MGQKNTDAEQSKHCRGGLDHWDQSSRSRLPARRLIQVVGFRTVSLAWKNGFVAKVVVSLPQTISGW
jgi:hypothetical protein